MGGSPFCLLSYQAVREDVDVVSVHFRPPDRASVLVQSDVPAVMRLQLSTGMDSGGSLTIALWANEVGLGSAQLTAQSSRLSEAAQPSGVDFIVDTGWVAPIGIGPGRGTPCRKGGNGTAGRVRDWVLWAGGEGPGAPGPVEPQTVAASDWELGLTCAASPCRV